MIWLYISATIISVILYCMRLTYRRIMDFEFGESYKFPWFKRLLGWRVCFKPDSNLKIGFHYDPIVCIGVPIARKKLF